MKNLRIDINSDFECHHCGSYVSASKFLAGVSNRNHCPYCLWSQHLDLFKAGDRLAACKASMRPVGLTLKRVCNKYASVAVGELMLVHQCVECDHVSINRIAADDIAEAIMEVYESSLVESACLRQRIKQSGIDLLGDGSFDSVYRQLFGQTVTPIMVTNSAI
jgi:hypothetical protein